MEQTVKWFPLLSIASLLHATQTCSFSKQGFQHLRVELHNKEVLLKVLNMRQGYYSTQNQLQKTDVDDYLEKLVGEFSRLQRLVDVKVSFRSTQTAPD